MDSSFEPKCFGDDRPGKMLMRQARLSQEPFVSATEVQEGDTRDIFSMIYDYDTEESILYITRIIDVGENDKIIYSFYSTELAMFYSITNPVDGKFGLDFMDYIERMRVYMDAVQILARRDWSKYPYTDAKLWNDLIDESLVTYSITWENFPKGRLDFECFYAFYGAAAFKYLPYDEAYHDALARFEQDGDFEAIYHLLEDFTYNPNDRDPNSKGTSFAEIYDFIENCRIYRSVDKKQRSKYWAVLHHLLRNQELLYTMVLEGDSSAFIAVDIATQLYRELNELR